jgi:hypothetical protein
VVPQADVLLLLLRLPVCAYKSTYSIRRDVIATAHADTWARFDAATDYSQAVHCSSKRNWMLVAACCRC